MPTFSTLPDAVAFIDIEGGYLLSRWALTCGYEVYDVLQHDEALAIGLANRVVPEGRLRREALGMARSAARMPLDGIAISRVMLETYLDSQGVGKEFDHAPFYRNALPQAGLPVKGRVSAKQSQPARGRK